MLELLNCGVFDSQLVFGGTVKTPQRIINNYEIELYISGKGYSFINGKKYPHVKDNLIFAKPGDKRYSENSFVCLFVKFNTDEQLNHLLRTIPSVTHFTKAHEFISIFNDLISLYQDHSSSNCLIIQSNLYLLLDLIYKQSTYTTLNSKSVLNKPFINIAVDFINNNYNKKIELNDIADSVNLSPVYFHKCFTKYTGYTPYKYLLIKRITVAKTLLLTTNMSISQISSECGFSTQSYFQNIFKKECNITPLRYRNKKFILP